MNKTLALALVLVLSGAAFANGHTVTVRRATLTHATDGDITAFRTGTGFVSNHELLGYARGGALRGIPSFKETPFVHLQNGQSGVIIGMAEAPREASEADVEHFRRGTGFVSNQELLAYARGGALRGIPSFKEQLVHVDGRPFRRIENGAQRLLVGEHEVKLDDGLASEAELEALRFGTGFASTHELVAYALAGALPSMLKPTLLRRIEHQGSHLYVGPEQVLRP